MNKSHTTQLLKSARKSGNWKAILQREPIIDGERRFLNGDYISAKGAQAAFQPAGVTTIRRQWEAAVFRGQYPAVDCSLAALLMDGF